MRILLHIGQSKTGTSAIQAFLTLNRSHLRQAGVLYPGLSIKGMPVELANHNAVADSLAGVSRFPNLMAHEYFERFFDEAARCETHYMLLSAEHLFGGEPRIWEIDNEGEYFSLYRTKISALAPFLKGHDVTVLVYLRPQIDWLESAIGQTIRTEHLITGRQVYQDDIQFFEMAKPLLKYCSLIDCWEECLRPSRIIVVPYEREILYKQSSVADFLHRAELEDLHLPYKGDTLTINQSLTREYIEVKKILNRHRKSKTEERVIIRCLEQLSGRNGKKGAYRISDGLGREVESFVSSENERLSARYMGRGQLRAQTPTSRHSTFDKIPIGDIERAMAEFTKEYSSIGSRLLAFNFQVRGFLRRHAKPVHAALHQLKRLQQWYVFRH